jgi:pre-rRNA-processing protein IPI3
MEQASQLYEHSFQEHTLRVTDIVTGYGGGNAIIISASEDRTCKVDVIFVENKYLSNCYSCDL